ncbi:hypothetical protein [Lacisediminimonas sp.]|uniref:hypothetical protein n=1 Tax=Lacisediminimonas sp. TaxID=3060582 RepID=UPI002728D5B6|nr:hypothetical protein [Lacisediminimonas sp.]MDO8300727.1 hypothetical protein [Lacisediminimonas sp.]
MKRAISLEEERQALLEQIHSSRADYRRMLAQYDQPRHEAGSGHAGDDAQRMSHLRGMPAPFPRSRTMRWIVSHPYAVAGVTASLVAVAVIGPRRIADAAGSAPGIGAIRKTIQRKPQRRQTDAGAAPAMRTQAQGRDEATSGRQQALGGAALAGITGVVSMLLRDPARMRMLARAAGAASAWWKRRQQAQRIPHPPRHAER